MARKAEALESGPGVNVLAGRPPGYVTQPLPAGAHQRRQARLRFASILSSCASVVAIAAAYMMGRWSILGVAAIFGVAAIAMLLKSALADHRFERDHGERRRRATVSAG